MRETESRREDDDDEERERETLAHLLANASNSLMLLPLMEDRGSRVMQLLLLLLMMVISYERRYTQPHQVSTRDSHELPAPMTAVGASHTQTIARSRSSLSPSSFSSSLALSPWP